MNLRSLLRSRPLAIVAAGALLAVAGSAQVPAGGPERYVVQVAPGATVDPAAIAGRHGLAPGHVFRRATRGFSAEIPPGRLPALMADPDVLAVVPDRAVSTAVDAAAKGGGTRGGGTSSGQVTPAGVQRIGAAPGTLAYTGLGVGVAIVDTGIDFFHPDLAVASAQFSAFGTSAQDDNGHGTHVAGIVAALANDRDVVGVAPGATLYAVKVLDASGSGYDSDILAGLEWIATQAAVVSPSIRVANLSLGRPGTLGDNPALRQAVQSLYQLGITVIVAAGNDAAAEVRQRVPATYPEVLAVASASAREGTSATSLAPVAADTASHFTTDGALDQQGIGVIVSAPGEDQADIIKGNRLQSVGILSTRLGGGTTRMSGTSMAAPHVAGVVALLYEQTPTEDAYEAKLDIAVGAEGAGALPRDGRTTAYTYDGAREGMLSAAGALAAP